MKISTSQYAKTLLELTENKSEQESLAVVIKFVQQLQKDGQLKNAPKIMEKFGQLYNETHGIVEAKVSSRENLSQDILGKIKAFVKDKYSAKEVVLETAVDGNIKGGIIIKVGDEIVDGSVSAQLKKLKNLLSK
jgi:F-type H+-transporting ATPase subunit delta